MHLSAVEARAARHPDGSIARRRYRAGQWGDIGRWRRTDTFDRDWFGLPAADLLPGIKLVWLPGHTDGHCGVAIDTGGHWLLHAGDAVFNRRELDPRPSTPPAARAYQWMMQTSQVRRRRSLKSLRTLLQHHTMPPRSPSSAPTTRPCCRDGQNPRIAFATMFRWISLDPP